MDFARERPPSVASPAKVDEKCSKLQREIQKLSRSIETKKNSLKKLEKRNSYAAIGRGRQGGGLQSPRTPAASSPRYRVTPAQVEKLTIELRNVSAELENLQQQHTLLQEKYNLDLGKLGRETSLQRLRIRKLVAENLKLKEELAGKDRESIVQVGTGIQQISVGGESHGIKVTKSSPAANGGSAAFIITRNKLT